ncbi:hypothetical protein BU26DRAFT_44157 [Trematosphaeria pertusa]|uniref:DNA helicase Pif1-like 2B domain-containing protein n=1 Tax=Trematosphaeria pertusa TaxID=390896 RepID=A0A6A6J3Q7_9PLEO|nr:uncharacterized protein BU26DRAFT_44157 [Trematosphaeria pertusa]KAF2257454.1 hypothetical protein BU26DRAFT_44157 [Trematosphaeria pertusa]
MRVVLLQNLEPTAGLVNGSQGTIVDFEHYDSKWMPRKGDNRDDEETSGVPILGGSHARYRQQQIKDFVEENDYQPWPVVEFDHNALKRTIYADCTTNEYGDDEPYSLLSRTQIPLMAGYAITVHKAQGMTLDRVKVDLSQAFDPSQTYVARTYYRG